MPIRLPAVEDIFGAPLDQLTATDIQRAVADHVRELPDLDFKQTRYENVEELAKDVAAMANATGGLLVLGIRDEDGLAQEVTPVAISDDEERRMHQGLRSRTVPFILEVEIRPVVFDTAKPGERTGCYLIAVGRSLLAPHGVMAVGDDKKRTYWPVRDGTTTRFLAEPELAEFYRRRFSGDKQRDKELRRLWSAGLERLHLDRIWLAVAAVPALPGTLPSGVAALRRVQDIAWTWADGTWPQSSPGLNLKERLGRFAPGIRRTIWDADSFNRDHPNLAYGEFHRSGASFVAMALAEHEPNTVLHQQTIEAELIGLLHLLGRHAAEARAGGELTIQVGLRMHKSLRATLGRRLMGAEPTQIPGAFYANGPFTAEPFTVGLDELFSYEGAARVAYQFALDLAGRYGVVDAGLVTEKGTLRQDSGGLPGFFHWAEQVGLRRELA